MSFGSGGFSFGQSTQPTQQSSGGLFGQSNANQSSSAFSLNAKRTKSFGSSSSQPQASSLFGNTSNTTGTSQNNALGQSTTTTTAPTFGASTSGSSLGSFGAPKLGTTQPTFGQSTFGQTSNNSIFGNQNNTNKFGGGGLFGSQNSAVQTQPVLTTSVDQPSFTLPGVKPSPTLYTSLSVPAVKRSHKAAIYELPSRPLASRSRIAGSRFKEHDSDKFGFANLGSARLGLNPDQSVQDVQDVANKHSETARFPSSLVSAGNLNKAEPHHWVNSYEEFVEKKPTTLVIRHHPGLPEHTKHIIEELKRKNLEIPIARSRSEIDEVYETSEKEVADEPRPMIKDVLVNEKAQEEGYYMSPSIEEIAEMSPSELEHVSNLTIGREKYGEISYNTAVDLSRLQNPGDILGKLVVFNPGTVCVYPDEATKKSPGNELNMPCTVTIEDAWPRSSDRTRIKDMNDRRMRKHIERLRKISEERGGEYITFTRTGNWVFKVPHFSTWGLPTSEMVVESDDEFNDEIEDFLEQVDQGDIEDVKIDYGVIPLKDSESIRHRRGAHKHIDSVSSDVNGSELDAMLDDDDVMDIDETNDNVVDEITYETDIDKQAKIKNAVEGYKKELSLFLGDVEADDIKKTDSWIKKLSSSKKFLSGREIPVDALKENIKGVSFSELLFNPTKLNEEEEQYSIEEEEAELPIEQLDILKFENLSQYFVKNSRKGSDIPIFQTKVKFSDLEHLSPGRRSLWSLLSILYEKNANQDALATWFDNELRLSRQQSHSISSSLAEGVFEALFFHEIEKASNLLADAGNTMITPSYAASELALLVNILDDKKHLAITNSSAEKQLDYWKTHEKEALEVPEPVRHIWELAAGKHPRTLYPKSSWQQWLGVELWYSSKASMKDAIKTLPNYTDSENSIELKFLKGFYGEEPLLDAVKELNLVDAFLCLQALKNVQQSSTDSSLSDMEYEDQLYEKLATSLNNTQLFVSAVYVALHIFSEALASSMLRKILLRGAVNVDLPTEFGMPDRVLNEARACQVSKMGDHVAEAEYLIRAKRYDEAHNVIINTVGPQAVISNDTSQILGLLSTLEDNSTKISDWERGGLVYLSFARAKALGAQSVNIVSLCFNCQRCLTPTNISKRAVAVMSEWVANSSSSIPTEDVVKMQFDPNQYMIQLLQQSARILS